MATIVMDADSVSLVLNGTVVNDFAEGDIVEMSPANPRTSRINGGDGSVNIKSHAMAGVYDLVVRVQKYSESDVFLNAQLNQEPPVVFNGSLKEDFIRDGDEAVESWVLEDGTFTAQPTNTKNNTDGNAMMEYTIQFRNATRNI